jgi:DNA-binding NarL/FixJ family response regulator
VGGCYHRLPRGLGDRLLTFQQVPISGRPDAPIGVVVVDDRRLARIAAKAIVEESRDLAWLGEASSADEAISLIPRVRPQVVLLDVEMPGVDGAETARRLKTLVPDLVILAWTVSDEGDDLLRMLQAGCVGYALKESGPAELHNAIRAALRNETVVPRRMLGAILRQAADYVPDAAAERVVLTPTEMTILRLIAKGLPSKQIALRVGIAPSSVETHIRNIYRKLDANSRTAAVGFALKRRLLKVSDL